MRNLPVVATLRTARSIGEAVLAVLAVVIPAPVRAQDAPVATLEHRFADVGGTRLEYFQFGDSGTSVVLIQDFHDSFHDESVYSREWVDFLRRLGSTHHLVAPVRRGWGESDDPGSGYDVPSQARDVLGLMDALGLSRAVLVGRTATTQEMTWIAEHHAERVIALAYLGTPLGHLQDPDPDPEVSRFHRMYSRTSCDIGAGTEVDTRLAPRSAWRPDFSRNPDLRIEVPALLVLHPVFDRVSMDARRVDRIEAWEPDDFGNPDGWCDDEAKAYFTELSRDTARLEMFRQKFAELNELIRTQEAMRRVFEGHLTIVWEEDSPDGSVDRLVRILTDYVADLQRAR